MFLQIEESTAHRLGGFARKRVQTDIADIIGTHTIIGNLWHLDATTRNLEVHLLARRRTQNLQHERCARLTTQVAADIADVLVRHHRIVNLQNDITLLQAYLRRRHPLIRFLNDYPLQLLMIAHQRSDTGILTRQHLLQLLLFLLRIILRIRVQRLQHSIDTHLHHLIGIKGIDIHHVQILIKGIEDIQVLRHLQIVILTLLCPGAHYGRHTQHYHYKSLLHKLIFFFLRDKGTNK